MGGATVFLLYAMLAVPFAVWSARASRASALGQASDRVRGRPGPGATIFLLILPLVLVLACLLSGLVAVSSVDGPPSEWSAYAFLAMSPALGMMLGYGLGWLWARRNGSSDSSQGEGQEP